jgi:hypothetical protein
LRDLGVVVPAEFASAPLAYDPASRSWSPTGALVNLPAIFIILVLTVLLVVGIKESVGGVPLLVHSRRQQGPALGQYQSGSQKCALPRQSKIISGGLMAGHATPQSKFTAEVKRISGL